MKLTSAETAGETIPAASTHVPNLTPTATSNNDSDAETNNVPERSPDLIFDGPMTSENRNFVPLETGNQYDLTSARFGDFSLKHDLTHDQQIANTEVDPSNNGYGGLSSNTHEDFTRSFLSKRFNEFVGKRGTPSFSSDDGTRHDDGLSTVGMWISSPESYLGENENRISSPASIESHINAENLLRHLYNELRDDDLLKRQYEFVGKRNYDFVGKRNYDFVGKRNYDFVGKRSYDFLGKRSPYDFIGKREPFHFIYKKCYDSLGKRAPYEFIGKRNEEIEWPIDTHSIIPSWQTGGRPSTIYDNILPPLSPNAQAVDDTCKRYSEFLGKKKRSLEGTGLSTNERLAALLQNNGLRKRLSKLLLNQRSHQYNPDFVGK